MLAGASGGAAASFGGGAVGLTNDELRAEPVAVAVPDGVVVTGAFWQATQPISAAVLPLPTGAAAEATLAALAAKLPTALASDRLKVDATGTMAVTGTFWPATQPVSGTVSVSNFPASQAVTGTFWQATQPISAAALPLPTGAAAEATLAALAVKLPSALASDRLKVDGSGVTQPVSGTFWQATQPVSGTVAVSNFPAVQPISGTVTATGPLTDAQLRAVAVPVSLAALPLGTVTLGNTQGKTRRMQTAIINTTSASADQVILTFTVTAGQTFYMTYLTIQVRLNTFAATVTNFGDVSLESPSGTKLLTRQMAGTGSAEFDLVFAEPQHFAAGQVVRVVCTPSATTNFRWAAAFGGYEK